MHFEVTDMSRGDIRLKNKDKPVRVLSEALFASARDIPGYFVYLEASVGQC